MAPSLDFLGEAKGLGALYIDLAKTKLETPKRSEKQVLGIALSIVEHVPTP